MGKTRYEKLADRVKIFKASIEGDFEKAVNILTPFSSSSLLEERNSGFLLRCETATDRTQRLLLRGIEDRLEREKHKIYYDQIENQDSQLWQNLRAPVGKVYKKWLQECLYLTERGGYRNTKHQYLFSPEEDESLQSALSKTTNFIINNSSKHLKNLAVSYYKILITLLFKGSGIEVPKNAKVERSPAYGLKILRDFGFSHEKVKEWQDQKFLKNLPGRRPLSQSEARLCIEAMIEVFLEDPIVNKTFGESCLVIWILLACAYKRRRFCGVADIFKMKESSLILYQCKSWDYQRFGQIYALKVKSFVVPISTSLTEMLCLLSDRRAHKTPIIQIDRSTLENNLYAVTEKLTFDHKTRPITPETFLERPILD